MYYFNRLSGQTLEKFDKGGRLFTRFLDTNGDGTGTRDAITDYSSAVTDFFVQPAANEFMAITRMIVEIVDSAFSAAGYGALAALTNGIEVLFEDNRQTPAEYSLTEEKIKSVSNWGSYCYDTGRDAYGAGDETMHIRWTFEKAGIVPVLEGSQNDKCIVRVNDNFTGLVEHRFQVQGIFFEKP